MVVKVVERKITKVGNSLGVTLPAEVLSHIQANQGDDIKFHLEENGTVSFKKTTNLNLDGLEGIDQDFIDGVKELFENYDTTLRNLADR
ncbi:AbrB/MazE/SpoVT family DNA-binding domain-containing protein [Sporosarcina limicola]|uniref:Addiction module antidote n=1 Tax=Sporosarcina limicola TaxID=34101 RepID=A0A927ML40_9BACL|nr:AbrB/MazE/SpoVT family DNA-binding domain-containing protein [Sporosarcina limicola]MBE1556715.1 putative addiction module antidote [Sporosarcina limicola]